LVSASSLPGLITSFTPAQTRFNVGGWLASVYQKLFTQLLPRTAMMSS